MQGLMWPTLDSPFWYFNDSVDGSFLILVGEVGRGLTATWMAEVNGTSAAARRPQEPGRHGSGRAVTARRRYLPWLTAYVAQSGGSVTGVTRFRQKPVAAVPAPLITCSSRARRPEGFQSPAETTVEIGGLNDEALHTHL
jgi:hypothetical protein